MKHKSSAMLDLALDDDLDLSLGDIDDILDMDGSGGDDLLMLELEDTPADIRLERLPSTTEQRRFVEKVARMLKAGKVKDAKYEGVKGADGTTDTIGGVFRFWHKKLLRDGNRVALEVAYVSGARLLSGRQHVDVSSPRFKGFLDGEVMQFTEQGHVLVDVAMPDPHTIKSNHKDGLSKHRRLVWFNSRSGAPLDAAEPFSML